MVSGDELAGTMSDTSDLAERTARALGKYGLDLCEMYLLDNARLESPVPTRLFASFTKEGTDGDPRGGFTLAEYEEGLARLIQKGLLAVVTPAEIEAEAARDKLAGIPAVRVRNYFQEDNVDFTQRGYDLNIDVIREIWGETHLRKGWSGWHVDSAAQRIDLYGSTADECQRIIDHFCDPVRPRFGKTNHRYVLAQPPSPIGAWSPKRFVTLASGFHGVLTYTVEPETG
jgi:hypothetical protein